MRWREFCLCVLHGIATSGFVILLSWIFSGAPHTGVQVADWLDTPCAPLCIAIGLVGGFADAWWPPG